MQMDSVDRGSQTAEFGGISDAATGVFNQSKDGSHAGGYHAIVEEICQTFTTIRDFKRKEALQVLSQIVMTAKFHQSST